MASLRLLSVGMSVILGSLMLPACSSSSSAPSDSGGSTSMLGDSGGLTCPGGSTTLATTSVTAVDFSFSPRCILVAAGSTVTWTNTGTATHTVTSDTGAPVTFDSGALGSGGIFTFTFANPGTVNYHCTPHQSMGMVGTVFVQ